MEFEPISFKELEENKLYKYQNEMVRFFNFTFYPSLFIIKENRYICPRDTIYKPIFGKAQQSMERRAINLVLQKLIPYYEW